MIEIIKANTQINFVSKFKFTGVLSLLMVLTFLVLTLKNLNYGVDFRGGAEVQVKFAQEIDVTSLRGALKTDGHGAAIVQTIGEPEDNEYLIKVLSLIHI